MGKKTLEEIIKEMKELGFDETLVQIAYSNVDGKEESIFDEIFRLQNESTQYPTVTLPSLRSPPTRKTRMRSSARPSKCPSARPRTRRSPWSPSTPSKESGRQESQSASRTSATVHIS